VRDNYIATGLIFTDSDFCEIVMNVFLLTHQDSAAETPVFRCSTGFAANFKNGLLHFSQRTFQPSVRENESPTWLDTIREFLQNVSWNRIINCHQRSWFLHPNDILTWTEVGATSVQTRITGNEKENITVVGSMADTGDKLSLQFIATATGHALKQLKLDQLTNTGGIILKIVGRRPRHVKVISLNCAAPWTQPNSFAAQFILRA
jgi:hypothetical protein